jgi:hypothetical protein
VSLFADTGPLVRPDGVHWLGLGCFALAAYLAINGLLVMLGVVSFASGAYWLGGLETMGPLIYLIVAAAVAVLGFGLLRGWRWMRRIAIIAAGLLVATAVMPLSGAVAYSHIFGVVIHGAKVILAIVIIRYLLQSEVVEWFSAKSGSRST